MGASLVAQLVKNLPAIRETWVRFLGWEDPLEKGKATHSSILAWRIPWIVQSTGLKRVRHDWVTFTSSSVENSMEFPLKTNNRATIWSCNPTAGHISGEKHNSKRYLHPVFIPVLFTLAKIWKQCKCPQTEECIKLWRVCVCAFMGFPGDSRDMSLT